MLGGGGARARSAQEVVPGKLAIFRVRPPRPSHTPHLEKALTRKAPTRKAPTRKVPSRKAPTISNDARRRHQLGMRVAGPDQLRGRARWMRAGRTIRRRLRRGRLQDGRTIRRRTRRPSGRGASPPSFASRLDGAPLALLPRGPHPGPLALLPAGPPPLLILLPPCTSSPPGPPFPPGPLSEVLFLATSLCHPLPPGPPVPLARAGPARPVCRRPPLPARRRSCTPPVARRARHGGAAVRRDRRRGSTRAGPGPAAAQVRRGQVPADGARLPRPLRVARGPRRRGAPEPEGLQTPPSPLALLTEGQGGEEGPSGPLPQSTPPPSPPPPPPPPAPCSPPARAFPAARLHGTRPRGCAGPSASGRRAH